MGEVWAWPTLLFDHNDALFKWDVLNEHTCRWRQWEPGGKVDFDPGASEEDKAKVLAWIAAVS